MAAPPGAPSSKAHLRTRTLVVTVVTVAVIVLVALFTVPIPRTFSGTLSGNGEGSATSFLFLSLAKGSPVSGTFSSEQPLGLVIWDTNGNVVYENDSTSGSFSFTASNPGYTFTQIDPGCCVSVSGRYTSPILYF